VLARRNRSQAEFLNGIADVCAHAVRSSLILHICGRALQNKADIFPTLPGRTVAKIDREIAMLIVWLR
jgi:hypothetical protein